MLQKDVHYNKLKKTHSNNYNLSKHNKYDSYSLLIEEKDICLIDRRQPNSQASGSNAGSLHVQLLIFFFGITRF